MLYKFKRPSKLSFSSLVKGTKKVLVLKVLYKINAVEIYIWVQTAVHSKNNRNIWLYPSANQNLLA